MANISINNKGQLSIEFILIITIILLLLQLIILPMRDYSESTITNISKINYADKAIYDLKNVIDKTNSYHVANIGLNIYVPKDTNIVIRQNNVEFNSLIDTDSSYCPNRLCNKKLILSTNINNAVEFIGGSQGIKYNVVVKKNNGVISIIKN